MGQRLCGSLRECLSDMTGQRNQLLEDVRFRIMRLLHDNPEMTQRELADEVGISVGRAHYVLKALVDKGIIKLGNFSAAKDKRRYAYILTPKGISEKAIITKRFLARKVVEYSALKAEIESLRDELDAGSDRCSKPSGKRE